MAKTISVVTQHNDNNRSGSNLQEELLNTSNVNEQQFGKLFERSVDGHIYAQPLYVSNVAIPNQGTHNVVYVATMHNSVYAFDADDPQASTPLWQVSLGPSAPLPDPNIGANIGLLDGLKVLFGWILKYPAGIPALLVQLWGEGIPQAFALFGPYDKQIAVEVGIISTPVISLEHNTIYVVAFTKVENTYVHTLHALDLATGKHLTPGSVELHAAVAGTGDGSVNGKVSLMANRQIQRSALLLSNGTLYIAFASFGDADPYHGWVLAYDATTLQPTGVYNTTPNLTEGGIWMGGQGPAADSSHNVYIMTGNGDFQEDASALGDCIVKLNPDLTVNDWFAPFNTIGLTEADMDLGSSGAMLIPDTELLVGGGKEGKFYLLDRNHLGRFNAKDDSQIVQSFYVSQNHHIHGGPVHWSGPEGSWIYVWPENDYLRAYRLIDGHFQTEPISQSTTTSPTGTPGGAPGMPGGMLSISANGDSPGSGILWASHPYNASSLNAVVQGIVRAYDASDLTRELWNSKMNEGRDDVGNFAKFCPPTIANGKVYVASFSKVLVAYGLLPSQ